MRYLRSVAGKSQGPYVGDCDAAIFDTPWETKQNSKHQTNTKQKQTTNKYQSSHGHNITQVSPKMVTNK